MIYQITLMPLLDRLNPEIPTPLKENAPIPQEPVEIDSPEESTPRAFGMHTKPSVELIDLTNSIRHLVSKIRYEITEVPSDEQSFDFIDESYIENLNNLIDHLEALRNQNVLDFCLFIHQSLFEYSGSLLTAALKAESPELAANLLFLRYLVSGNYEVEAANWSVFPEQVVQIFQRRIAGLEISRFTKSGTQQLLATTDDLSATDDLTTQIKVNLRETSSIQNALIESIAQPLILNAVVRAALEINDPEIRKQNLFFFVSYLAVLDQTNMGTAIIEAIITGINCKYAKSSLEPEYQTVKYQFEEIANKYSSAEV